MMPTASTVSECEATTKIFYSYTPFWHFKKFDTVYKNSWRIRLKSLRLTNNTRERFKSFFKTHIQIPYCFKNSNSVLKSYFKRKCFRRPCVYHLASCSIELRALSIQNFWNLCAIKHSWFHISTLLWTFKISTYLLKTRLVWDVIN